MPSHGPDIRHLQTEAGASALDQRAWAAEARPTGRVVKLDLDSMLIETYGLRRPDHARPSLGQIATHHPYSSLSPASLTLTSPAPTPPRCLLTAAHVNGAVDALRRCITYARTVVLGLAWRRLDAALDDFLEHQMIAAGNST